MCRARRRGSRCSTCDEGRSGFPDRRRPGPFAMGRAEIARPRAGRRRLARVDCGRVVDRHAGDAASGERIRRRFVPVQAQPWRRGEAEPSDRITAGRRRRSASVGRGPHRSRRCPTHDTMNFAQPRALGKPKGSSRFEAIAVAQSTRSRGVGRDRRQRGKGTPSASSMRAISHATRWMRRSSPTRAQTCSMSSCRASRSRNARSAIQQSLAPSVSTWLLQ